LLEYFAKQERIYPKRVKGKYRNLKWLVMIFTLGIYYLVPFLRFDRAGNAPDQAVLIDMEGHRAYWFWIEIWPQEIFLFTGILILAAIALFFVTSMFGRVWCGYLCPQTVWTDLYVHVERFVQGDRNARKRLNEGPWTFQKVWKIGLTHALWLLIAFCTGGAFVNYFNDAPTVVHDMFHLQLPVKVWGWMAGLTFSTYLMAGFAREQVCTYMCPYARFQSAMFDKDTLIISYDEKRGETRGKHKAGDPWDNRGHCIDCTACVQVCPMGIDIRNGLQMECIACGLCVDACNEVMDKVDLPRGLIRYDTTNHMNASVKGGKERFRFFRVRTIYYSMIMGIVGGTMLAALIFRAPVELHVLHDRNPLFVQLSSGEIRNGYTIKILNKTHDDKVFSLSVDGLPHAMIDLKAAGHMNADHIRVDADAVASYHIHVHADVTPDAPRDVTFTLTERTGDISDSYDSVFVSQKE